MVNFLHDDLLFCMACDFNCNQKYEVIIYFCIAFLTTFDQFYQYFVSF